MMKRFAALLLCLLFVSTAAAEGDIPELLEPVGVTMDTATAYIGDLRETTMYDAYVAPEVSEVYFQIDGRIGDIYVAIGQEVKAGEILATLDHTAILEASEELRLDIQVRKQSNAYDDAIAAIDLEMLELELAQLLSQPAIDKKAVALKELDIREKKLAIEKAQRTRTEELGRMSESLAEYEKKLALGAVAAPFDGRIAAAPDIEPGTYMVAYSPVVYLADDTKLSIVSEFISGTEISGAAEMYALIGGEQFDIVHREMDAQEYAALVMAGATINVTFDFAAVPPATVKPGAYAGVCIVRNKAENALLVPSNAIFSDDGGKYVYTVHGNERVRTYVKTGLTTAWETQILDGIGEGTVVYVQE